MPVVTVRGAHPTIVRSARRRGGAVRLRKAPAAEGELQALEATLAPEWNSPDDDAAYADL